MSRLEYYRDYELNRRDKSKAAENQKLRYKKNPEKFRKYKREWTANNREIKRESDRKSYIKNRKKRLIKTWEKRGVISDDFSKLYDDYDKAWFCGICLTDFKNNFDKCLDHNHTTGEFREFLCRKCNANDHWKKVLAEY